MSQAHNRGEYVEQFKERDVTAAHKIDIAIKLLMPGATHKAIPALFDRRVHWETVRAWRNGWRGVPQWALDLVSAKLTAHGARYLEAAQIPAKPGPGRKGAIHYIRAAQARRASPSR